MWINNGLTTNENERVYIMKTIKYKNIRTSDEWIKDTRVKEIYSMESWGIEINNNRETNM